MSAWMVLNLTEAEQTLYPVSHAQIHYPPDKDRFQIRLQSPLLSAKMHTARHQALLDHTVDVANAMDTMQQHGKEAPTFNTPPLRA